MKRALATAGTFLLLALPLAGCGNDDSPASSAAPTPTDTSEPANAARPELKHALPAAAPQLPAAAPGALAPSGASFDACTVVPPDAIAQAFGIQPGEAYPEESGLGDASAADCFYFSSDVVLAAEATSDADQYMPEDAYSYAGLAGAEPVPDADRGWAYIMPGQDGSATTVSSLILVKDGKGMCFSISVANHPYDMDGLQAFAAHVLSAMAAAS